MPYIEHYNSTIKQLCFSRGSWCSLVSSGKMAFVRVKKEPVDERDPSYRETLSSMRNFRVLRRDNLEIVATRQDDLEARAIQGAVGRYRHHKQLKERYGENTDSDVQSPAGTKRSRSAMEIEDVKAEEEEDEEEEKAINSDEEMARRRRRQSREKAERSDNKRRRRKDIPHNTWLNKVPSGLSASAPLTEEDRKRRKGKKYQVGFIGDVKPGEFYIDDDGIVQAKGLPKSDEEENPEGSQSDSRTKKR